MPMAPEMSLAMEQEPTTPTARPSGQWTMHSRWRKRGEDAISVDLAGGSNDPEVKQRRIEEMMDDSKKVILAAVKEIIDENEIDPGGWSLMDEFVEPETIHIPS